MEITLSQESIALLNAMLREPRFLGLDRFGMKEYSAKDQTGAKQVMALQKWLTESVCEKQPDKSYKFPEDGWTGSLKKTYVDRLQEIVKHHETIGMTVQFVSSYMQLISSLEGKTVDVDDPTESVSEEVNEVAKAKDKAA